MTLAAQVGAGFTAELGAMRVNEEIDALEVMAVRPVPYLVSTRIIAALVAITPLYLISLFASYLATELVVTKLLGLSGGTYAHYFSLFLPASDVFYSLIKAMTFAVGRCLDPLLLRVQRNRRPRRRRHRRRQGDPGLDRRRERLEPDDVGVHVGGDGHRSHRGLSDARRSSGKE